MRLAVAGAVAALTLSMPVLAEEHPDFTGVWTWYIEPGSNPFAPPAPDALPFTPEGKRLADEYKQLMGPNQDNPGAFCVDYGMPTMMEMAGGYPIEFIQKPDQITIIYEVEGETRRIYFGDRNLAPADRIPSRQGYSWGRWEGSTLVVETDNLTDGQDQMSHPHSDQATIVERFDLGKDPEGKKLVLYEMTMTDPVYYSAPVTVKKKWAAMPDGHIIAYNCTEEAWLKLLNARRAQLKAGQPVTATMKDVTE